MRACRDVSSRSPDVLPCSAIFRLPPNMIAMFVGGPERMEMMKDAQAELPEI